MSRHDLQAPLVSIVCATYNRSDVLGFALGSVLAQTSSDWELLVVGDACTDDTAAVVASFADDRITFHNRAVNHGEQSATNNDGVAMAHGELLAFLNHDDVWMPDHLERCIAHLDQAPAGRGADLVFGGYATVFADGTAWRSSPLDIRRSKIYESPPASTWVLRRSLAERVGPWRSGFELHGVPSVDWLARALRAGARVEGLDTLTVVCIPSGFRHLSYVRPLDESDLYGALATEGRSVALGLPPQALPWHRRLLRVAWRPLAPLVARAGLHPHVVRARCRSVLTGRRHRGDVIRRLRTRRGLPADPAKIDA